MTSCGLNDCVVYLDEFFKIVGPIIFVDRLRLELVWPDNLSKLKGQHVERAPA
jgi:hypothetical protein